MFIGQSDTSTDRAVIRTDIGKLCLSSCNGKLTDLIFVDDLPLAPPKNGVLILACRAILDYFRNPSAPDSFPEELIRLNGTPTQQLIWLTLKRQVKNRQLCSYSSLAELVHRQNSSIRLHPRQIGNAMAHNPLPLFIPCHRVLPKNGTLGHYSAGQGAVTKALLLEREGHTLIPKPDRPLNRAFVKPWGQETN